MSTERCIELTRWQGAGSGTGFGSGHHDGTRCTEAGLVWAETTGTRAVVSRGREDAYDTATWTSDPVPTGFGATELLLSWHAVTPAGTFVEFCVQGRTDSGATTGWYSLGRWAHDDAEPWIRRTSVPDQGDVHADVHTDVLTTRDDVRLTHYAVRVVLHRAADLTEDTRATPAVRMLTALATRLPTDPAGAAVTTSTPGPARGVTLPVPALSQMIHQGHLPQYNGGGEAWCSPTSTAMVLDHLELGPDPASLRWLPTDHPDPQVDHAARMTYDHAYGGTGNWSFNVAYANHQGADAFLTRFRSLRDAEPLLAAGVPLVVGTTFRRDDLAGSGYDTAGHLMLVVGITDDGDVVVNDPASHLEPSNDRVRTVYRRDEFERAWLPTSGGLAYVITARGFALPTPEQPGNW